MKASNFLCLSALLVSVLAMSACGGGGAPPGAGSGGPPAPVVVAVSPKALSISLNTQRQFTATASDGLGVTWSMNPNSAPYGSIDFLGLYTAPTTLPSPAVFTITATSQSDPTKFDTATVTLVAGPVYGAFPVKFDVKSRGGWQGTSVPTTLGIPLARNIQTDVNQLDLQLQSGASVPAQFRVTSRWPTTPASIRWVMVDFLADLSGAGGVGKYQLNNTGTGSATGTNLNVTSGASTIVVNTGQVEFTVNKNSFRLFDSVKIDRDLGGTPNDECLNTAAAEGIIVSEGATDYLMDQIAPTRVVVEEQGPIRVTIVAEGVHRSSLAVDKLNYVVRITAYNDLPMIRVQYSFKNMAGNGVAAATPSAAAAQLAQYETADSINMDLPLDFAAVPVSVYIGGNPTDHAHGAMSAGQYLSLYQDYTGTYDPTDAENPQPAGYNSGTGDGSSDPLLNTWPLQNDTSITYVADDSGTTSNVSTHAPGWMQMYGGNLRVTVAMQEFWQLHPKELRAQADGLMRVGIWPAQAGQLQVFAGAMKTHDLVLNFARGSSYDQATATSRQSFINDPPRGYCDPKHYAACLVFGDIATTNSTFSDVSAFRASSQAFAAAYMNEMLDHEGDILYDRTDGNGTATGHEYGMWHFGDSKHDTPVLGWENGDWGISHAALQWYAMSGNSELLYLAEVTSRHFRDVVVQHSDIGTRFNYTESGNPAVSGGKASQLGKTRYTPNNKQHDLGNYHLGENHLDVFRGAFLAKHYLLTGDALSLDVLKECYTYLRGTWKRFFDSGNGGTDSTMTCPTTWLSNALMIAAAYEEANGLADGSAATMTSYVLTAVRTRQSTVTTRDPNGVGFADNGGNFIAWQVGHLMEALEYTRWVRNDSTVDLNIENGMNWLLGTNAQVYLGNPPTSTFGAFAEMPGGSTDFGGPNLLIGAGYVGALRSSGSANWKSAADNLIDLQTTNINDTVIGDDAIRYSSFAQFFRAGPLLLATIKN
ncbi:MAG: hypothetical protein KDB90_01250 [Planctomycetes bacterium]|nr:hypothetical protein [Planctomycetota bacterium]